MNHDSHPETGPVIVKGKVSYLAEAAPKLGKVQGDSRKFLDHFKSYFGSQISSQSLNEIRIY